MKKTSIYILSIIVLAVLALSVILPSGRMIMVGWESFMTGFEMGMGTEAAHIDGTPMPIKYSPETMTMIQPTDSIQFNDGRQLPLVIDSVAVILPDSKLPSWYQWTILFTPLRIILMIIILWKFLRFIINVSKSRIFVAQNVKYLRQISFTLLAIACLNITEGYIQDYIFSLFSFTWKGYELGALWDFPWSSLLIAFVGLLLAQVWSYGIEIKQDQELTI